MMIAVLKGDMVASRKLTNQELWLGPLKTLLQSWGSSPETWEIVWGDFFQIEISDPREALHKALQIKSLMKSLTSPMTQSTIGTMDVRMAIGIGDKTFSSGRISESNGPAFIYSGEKFDGLKKENLSIGVKSSWASFDEEVNLYLRLAETFLHRWTVSAAELASIALQDQQMTQEEIGKQLGIKQSGVSGRWRRANIEELLLIERAFRKKIELLLP